jgi:hypothetical protein
MNKSYEETLEAFETAESRIAELEAEYIYTHRIASCDGYVPQSFDEIGDPELRELAQKELEDAFPQEVEKYKTLKAAVERERNMNNGFYDVSVEDVRIGYMNGRYDKESAAEELSDIGADVSAIDEWDDELDYCQQQNA